MKRLLATALLSAALLPAQGQSEQPLTQRALREQLTHMQAEAHKLDATAEALGGLPDAPFDPHSPMPEPPPGQSAAVADGGLVIDQQHGLLSYIGNVRLSDPHLQLRAARRLHIVLPQREKKQAAKTASEQEAAEPPPTSAPDAPAGEKNHQADIPAYLTVGSAVVDARDSRALLEGLSAAPSITLTRGADRMVLQTAADGAPARIFTNAEGEVLIEGHHMIFEWHGEKGEAYRLEAATGPALYSARKQQLCVQGHTRLSSATAELTCDKALEITFAATPAPLSPSPQSSPFAAFSTAQFKSIRSATAEGSVELCTPATATRPAGKATGDRLLYSADSSTLRLSGSCALAYGGFTLNNAGAESSILMTPDGSITISSGSPLSGAYERRHPDTAEGGLLPGTWQAGASIRYDAAANCITIPGGFCAQDSLTAFTTGGDLQLYLQPQEGRHAAQTPAKPGLPRLTIAEQESVRRVIATEGVKLQAQACGAQPACSLIGDTLDATLPSGEVLLTASAGRRADVHYEAYELTATAPAEGEAAIHLQPTGDILATGEELKAHLPGEKGPTSLTCTRSLHLMRESASLILGENSRLESPDGILTARAPLTAQLTVSDAPARAPKGYPQLSYNFTGLRRASTPSGGTLRTTQASLRCEGAMEIELIPGKPGADPRDMLRAASARGRVWIAGKDATGRLLRAGGDSLSYDPATRSFYLRGRSVTLADQYNTHTASGAGACVTIDPRNNVRITGRQQTTTAHHIHQQMESNKNK